MRNLESRQPQSEFSRMSIFHGGTAPTTAGILIPRKPGFYAELRQIVVFSNDITPANITEMRLQLDTFVIWRAYISSASGIGNFTYTVPVRTPELTDDVFLAPGGVVDGIDYYIAVTGSIIGVNDYGAKLTPPVDGGS